MQSTDHSLRKKMDHSIKWITINGFFNIEEHCNNISIPSTVSKTNTAVTTRGLSSEIMWNTSRRGTADLEQARPMGATAGTYNDK